MAAAGEARRKTRARDDRDERVARPRTELGEPTMDAGRLAARIDRLQAGGGRPFRGAEACATSAVVSISPRRRHGAAGV